MRLRLSYAIAAFVLCGTIMAQAALIDLYGDSKVALAGPNALNVARNQVFSPKHSSALPGGGMSNTISESTFNVVKQHLSVEAPGESWTVSFGLYPIVNSITTTMSNIANGSATPIAQISAKLDYPYNDYLTLNLPSAQNASSTYILSTKITAYTGSTGLQFWGVQNSSITRPADGYNDSYTTTAAGVSSFKNDRELSIRVPEPATMLLLALAAPVALRRRGSR